MRFLAHIVLVKKSIGPRCDILIAVLLDRLVMAVGPGVAPFVDKAGFCRRARELSPAVRDHRMPICQHGITGLYRAQTKSIVLQLLKKRRFQHLDDLLLCNRYIHFVNHDFSKSTGVYPIQV